MHKGLVATASITINAPAQAVWQALVTPAAIREYMFGTDVVTDWREGSPISWQGEWQGRPYLDKGVLQHVEPGRRLAYTHFSPLAGKPDRPENYHTVTIELAEDGGATRVTLTQDNNDTEQAREHSRQNWEMMLADLKKYVERLNGNA